MDTGLTEAVFAIVIKTGKAKNATFRSTTASPRTAAVMGLVLEGLAFVEMVGRGRNVIKVSQTRNMAHKYCS